MPVGPHPLVTLSALSGLVLGGLFVVAVRHRNYPGATSLAGIVGGAALWSLSYALALTTFDPGLRRLLELPIWTGRTAMPVAWMTFALAYAGRSDLVTRRVVAAVALPHAVTLCFIAVDPTGVLWTDYRIVGAAVATVLYDYGPLFVLDTLYSYALIAMGCALFLGVAVTSPRRYDVQVVALLVGTGVPTIASFAWVLRLSPVPGMDFTPVALSVTGLTFGYALFRTGILTATPGVQQTSVRAVLDDFSDAVVLLDERGHVLDTNADARLLLGVSERAAWRANVYDLLDLERGSVEPGTQRLTLDTPTGRRVFDLVVTRVTDPRDREVGFNLVFHDVTDREQRKQRLSVLNRILRHNLRNDLNVISGATASLEDADEATAADLRKMISAHAESLAALGEQAKEAQRVVERNDHTTREVELATFVSRIVAWVEDDEPDVRFELSIPDGLVVRTDVAILELVVRNAVENAVRRAAESSPRVEIEARSWRASRWVDLGVRSNGVGVPEQERVAIGGSEESALDHASALDLWLVRWGTTTIGGDVTLSDDGSTLHLHVPQRTDDPETPVGEGP